MMKYCQSFCIEYFTQGVNTCASSWMHKSKLKLKSVRPEKKSRDYDTQTRKNANPEEQWCSPGPKKSISGLFSVLQGSPEKKIKNNKN